MLITLEGGEGAGKSTQAKRSVSYIEKKELACVLTCEPGGTKIGKQIRIILLSSKNEGLSAEAELSLYLADRIQHVGQLINPALAQGKIVVCDRYVDASSAYQGYARGLGFKVVDSLHKQFNIPVPDITLLFDLPVEVGLARAKRRSDCGESDKSQDRFEEEDLTFHKDLRTGYLLLADDSPERFRIIDAERSEEAVWQQVKGVLDEILNQKEVER